MAASKYVTRAGEIAALVCVCLTFDLRGYARHAAQRLEVTREDNLRDVLAAYDASITEMTLGAKATATLMSPVSRSPA